MEEIRKIEQLMVSLEGQLREGRIDYSAPAPIAGKLNLSTFIFQEILLSHTITIGYHDKKQKIDYITLYITNTYRERMRFLLNLDGDEKVNLMVTAESGEGLLAIAVKRNHDDVVELLIQRGALYQSLLLIEYRQELIKIAEQNLLQVIDLPASKNIKDKFIKRVKRILYLLENARSSWMNKAV